jgi:LmbE family N-acetylglucosaminyl deacetylase
VSSYLLISPHADDEAAGAGGILDDRFHVHYCGVEHDAGERQPRLAEVRACADLLGFSFSVNLDNRTGGFQDSELVCQLEELINHLRPTTVFLPCPSTDQDHRAVLDAGLIALRQHDVNHSVSNVLLFEQVQASCWPCREDLVQGRAFQPTCFFPIDAATKIAACRCYRSLESTVSSDAVTTLARWRGIQAGTDHAEGYMVLRLTNPGHLVLGRLGKAEPDAKQR